MVICVSFPRMLVHEIAHPSHALQLKCRYRTGTGAVQAECRYSLGCLQVASCPGGAASPWLLVMNAAAAAFVVLLIEVAVRSSLSCDGEGQVLVCSSIPTVFRPGFHTLLMSLKDVGEMNSSVFQSEGLSSVSRLRMDAAGITGIADGAFRSLQNLSELVLKHNLLSRVNPKWLGRAGVLTELDLTGNQIQVLDGSMFPGLTNLTTLRLRGNRIREIHPDSFSSQTPSLSQLDLSDNRLTRLSPQVFRSLRLTRIGLGGNPWDCSCGVKDSVDFLRGLCSRSVLDDPLTVTCETPPSLRGKRVCNVSVCVPAPATQTASPNAASPNAASPNAAHVPHASPETGSTATPATQTTPEPGNPAQTDVADTSTRAAQPAGSPSAPAGTPAAHAGRPTTSGTSGTPGTSGTSGTGSGSKPSDRPNPASTSPTVPSITETCASSRPSPDSHLVRTLVVTTVILSLLLVAVSLLLLLLLRRRRRRRCRKTKTVTPEREEELEGNSSHSWSPSPSHSKEREVIDDWDTEMGWRRPVPEVRAKSANAILFTANCLAREKSHVSALSEDADGRIRTKTSDGNVTQPENVGENPGIPYLSISTDRREEEPEGFIKQRPQGGVVMARISTWPPTATQWQDTMEKQQEESGIFPVWTPTFETQKKKESSKVEHRPNPEREEKKGNTGTEEIANLNPAHGSSDNPQALETNDEISSPDEQMKTKRALQEQTRAPSREGLGGGEGNKSSQRRSGLQGPSGTQGRSGLRGRSGPQGRSGSQGRSGLRGRSGPQGRSGSQGRSGLRGRSGPQGRSGSQGRSGLWGRSGLQGHPGGASPNDETLLSGNEYAFMDLLHEVVQNNGRWTRERWKQTYVNKQSCKGFGKH